MPHEIHWVQEKRLLSVRVHGDMSVEDMIAAGQEIDAWLNQGETPVHVIVDMQSLATFPTSLRTIRQAAPYLYNPRLGVLAPFGVSSLAATFAQIILRMTNARYRLFYTYDEAFAYIVQVDASIAFEPSR